EPFHRGIAAALFIGQTERINAGCIHHEPEDRVTHTPAAVELTEQDSLIEAVPEILAHRNGGAIIAVHTHRIQTGRGDLNKCTDLHGDVVARDTGWQRSVIG